MLLTVTLRKKTQPTSRPFDPKAGNTDVLIFTLALTASAVHTDSDRLSGHGGAGGNTAWAMHASSFVTQVRERLGDRGLGGHDGGGASQYGIN